MEFIYAIIGILCFGIFYVVLKVTFMLLGTFWEWLQDWYPDQVWYVRLLMWPVYMLMVFIIGSLVLMYMRTIADMAKSVWRD